MLLGFSPRWTLSQRSVVIISLLLVTAPAVLTVTGCGGGSGSSSPSESGSPGNGDTEGTVQVSGPFTTRAVGTIQEPATSAGIRSVGTGLAGASFSSILFNRSAAQSLSNTRLVYQSLYNNKNQLYTTSPTSGAPVLLTTDGPDKFSPRWSPDGTKIVYFASDSNNYSQIYVIPAAGGTPKAITSGNTNKLYPSWSPDGSKIAFSGEYSGGRQIFTVAATGGTVTRLTNGVFFKTNAVWSPDGKSIAYYGGDATGKAQIWTVGVAAGSVETQLTSGNSDVFGSEWSPDGTRIAFSKTDSNGVFQLYTVASTGGTPTQVTTGNTAKTFPVWSPDGSLLLYNGPDNTNTYQLFSVPSSGGTPTAMTTGGTGNFAPHWSNYLPASPVVVVGTNGLFGASAAGYLYGQSGDEVTSILVFDTGASSLDSRSTARITNTTSVETASSNLIFNISSGDRLSTIKYINYDSNGIGTIVPITPGSAITNALVSLNSGTGKVATITTYAATKAQNPGSSNQPQITSNADRVLLQGHFTAVYNARGENISPGGANAVNLDRKTGEVISVH